MSDDYEVEVSYGTSGHETLKPVEPPAAAPMRSSEFGNFAELTAKLLRVPKAELDEQRGQTA